MRLVAGRFALSHLHGAALCFKLMTTNTNDRWVDALSQHRDVKYACERKREWPTI